MSDSRTHSSAERVRAFLLKARKGDYPREAHAALYDLDDLVEDLHNLVEQLEAALEALRDHPAPEDHGGTTTRYATACCRWHDLDRARVLEGSNPARRPT